VRVQLQDLGRCFHGIVPGLIATVGRDGTPNITYLSQVQYVDPTHVALSCQFFNKTRANITENPLACVQIYDPLTLEAYRLRLRFERSETEGPLFAAMSMRIQAIASQTGMRGVFRLLSADVFEVTDVEAIEGFLLPADSVTPSAAVARGHTGELAALQVVSDRINRAHDLEELLEVALGSLDELFGFRHSLVLLADETSQRLHAIASHGFGEQGIGAEVELGMGLIGTVAQQRRLLRMAGVDAELRYGRAVRGRVAQVSGATELGPEIPLAGLPDAQSQLAIPMVVQDRLIGVLAVQSRAALAFEEWHEAYLQIIGNQIAIGIDTLMEQHDEAADEAPSGRPAASAPVTGVRRCFVFYRNDDCVFVDGEYVIRNVPGRILWKILCSYRDDGRREFTNRELRLDPGLGLPPVRDNLESRLILLRKRLQAKCPEIRLVPVRRGRFALEVGCRVDLVEKETG